MNVSDLQTKAADQARRYALLKDMLSRVVNRIIYFVMGARVNDLTSGYRVYRPNALRQIRFENAGFAFLPEMLIDAAAKRLSIIEEPIRFVFREVGKSKMCSSPVSAIFVCQTFLDLSTDRLTELR